MESTGTLRERARALPVEPGTGYALLQKLIVEHFFDKPVCSEQVVLRIREVFGKAWDTRIIQTYMRKFMERGIITAIKPRGMRHNYWVLASVAREDALLTIRKSARVQEIEATLFSAKLTSKLNKNFRTELKELHDNFGQNGNATAFLLRKVLEKLIIIVFAKNQKESLLEEKGRPGGYKGLKDMIEVCAREKVSGIPFITPKTANEIKGLKFLGDTAAHNPLTDVDMQSILPQMPFMITAYEELVARL